MRNFQESACKWVIAALGPERASSLRARNHRFLEEALEVVQAAGCTRSEVLQLVDYVFAQSIGELKQEAGGSLIALAALCKAHDIDMEEAAWTELCRLWDCIEAIRVKQANKPKQLLLPQ